MKVSSSLVVCVGCIIILQTKSLENLAEIQEFHEIPTQSSSYDKHLYEAKNAIDGKFEEEGEEAACSFTIGGEKNTRAWWKLPLTQLCHVEYLLIYFRSSSCCIKEVQDVCQPCDPKCFNNLCDSYNGSCIYGCSNAHKEAPNCTDCIIGYYGKDCHRRCGHCKNGTYCDSTSGKCPEKCEEHWNGSLCDSCDDGYYGLGCSMECGHCKIGTFCNITTGICESGCQGHWREPKCDVCRDGYYGQDCEISCGKCKNETLCNDTNGDCHYGCQENWLGSRCDICTEGLYGPNCTQKCGHCRNESVCNNITGDCLQGCDEHWGGSKCDVCSVGFYGFTCNTTCGNCINGSTCDPRSGICRKGCLEHWRSPMCNMCKEGFHGPDCTQECGSCKPETICNHITGVCNDGCHKNWNGSKCNVCAQGLYGVGCSLYCGKCQMGTFCDNLTGVCPLGCQDDWQGLKCDEDNSGTDQAVGVTLGTIAVGSIFVIACMFLYNRRRKCKNHGSPDVLFSRFDTVKDGVNNIETEYDNMSAKAAGNCPSEENLSEENTYKNLVGTCTDININEMPFVIEEKGKMESAEKQIKKYNNSLLLEKAAEFCPSDENPSEENTYKNLVGTCTDINVNELPFVIEEKSKMEPNAFYTEYKRLPNGDVSRCQAAQLPENRIKNRFKTTYPYDNSRVVLEERWKDSDEEYINANYIKDFKDEKRYLAAQGPMSKTSSDFWRMIWQEQVECIVMLTNLIEGGKNKCFKYWPDKGEHLKVGLCRISLLQEIKYAFYTMRKLSIERTDTPMKRDIIQLHYTSWPDHGTPGELDLVQFHRAVMKRDKVGSPLLVHCSAGVGRTGTFIGYDALLKRGKETGRINVFEFVKKMREDRMTMIQTKEQYAFLHKALACGFLGEGMILKQTDLEIKINQLLNDNSPQNQQTLYKEYKLLSSLGHELKDNSTKVENDVTKATNSRDDKRRVFLTSYIKGRSDYINAVIVPSYTDLRGFIMTTYPIPDTDIDLWRLCVDHEVDVITVFVSIKFGQDIWWIPQRGQSRACSPFYITNQDTGSEVRGVIQEQLVLTEQKNRRDITLFRINPDKEEHIILGARFLLEKNIGEEVKTLVIGQDGNRAPALFIVLYNVLQQLRLDKEIDVFTAVRRIQSRNPNVFTTLEEYRMCYQMILDSVSEEVYANV
uniref:protein-tyrosine-phosphatase n=1 Tax=Crassostrea virginica TaxID=6565 RepID=A0A8B8C841_CRAVI|nr:uncharacterized protein LOC111117113 isoform X3 [Crassostrea virginica]